MDRALTFRNYVDDCARKKVAVVAGSSGYQIPVPDNILVYVDCPHVFNIAEQIVVRNNAAAANELGSRSHQPQPVADDALNNILIGKGTLEERCSRWQRVQI